MRGAVAARVPVRATSSSHVGPSWPNQPKAFATIAAWALPLGRLLTRSTAKAPGCLAERIALAKAEPAHRPDAEDDGASAPIGLAERAVADDEMPGVGAVLRRERLGNRLQFGLVRDLL